jgi:purine-nucleoside phosphorylase
MSSRLAAPTMLRRVADWRPQVAVVFGSGLATLPKGASVETELAYEDLGWPCTAVAGHANRLRLAKMAGAGGRALRLAMACGRPHRYEGWDDEELERMVGDLATAGVGRLLLTHSCGALRLSSAPGHVVVCTAVIDLQAPPADNVPARLPVCAVEQAELVAGNLAEGMPVRTGVYVSVLGPQFETPAEVEWLASYGDVVGMSAAPEVRAARAAGIDCVVLAVVVNRAAAAGSHEEVLASGSRLAGRLSAGLLPAARARWPELT